MESKRVFFVAQVIFLQKGWLAVGNSGNFFKKVRTWHFFGGGIMIIHDKYSYKILQVWNQAVSSTT